MYTFDDNFCYSDFLIKNGINRDSKSKWEKKIKDIFSVYSKANPQTKFYKILFSKDAHELLDPLQDIAKSIRDNFDDVVIVGMGGAILNPRAITSVRKHCESPRIHYLYTTDPIRYSNLIRRLKFKKTAVIVSSKSGGTTETIASFTALCNSFKQAGITDFKKHFHFITGSQKSPIREMAESFDAQIFEHDNEYGGRFSGFSSIGLLPGLIAGLDMEAFISGLNATTDDLWHNKEDSQPIKAALSTMLSEKPIIASVGYLDAFAPVLEWYAQIIAESLGKDEVGPTPVWGIGPMDQHSMLQLYLDGSRDKLFNMFYVDNLECDSHSLHDIVKPDYLAPRTLADINRAEFEATVTSLKNNNLPTRVITMDKFDEFNMGALMMHFAIEVITVGHMMEINPFDQPGVEQIKVEARKILSK